MMSPIFSQVFVNNRRVLKPKTSNQLRTDSPSNIKPSTPDKQDNKLDLINNLNSLKPSDSVVMDIVKSEKVNSLSDADVNDLIFEKVQDFESSVVRESPFEKPCVPAAPEKSSHSRNEQNLKIETISKRLDNGIKNCGDRKNESSKGNSSHCGRMDSNMNGHMNVNDEAMSNMHQTFGSIMNPGVDSGSQLLTHFPTTTQLVTSVQQQFLNNPLPMNAIEPLQWPIIYNNMPLHSMFGATMNPTTNSSNWINNGLNIAPPHQINQSRILTKEEFYERQRRMRAEK